MSNEQTPYNQIDFVIKAPRFRIVFSYINGKATAFVLEYLLRLLKLTPCKPEQIAQYFGFNQHETEVALEDLEKNHWINWQTDGTIELSAEGLRLFSGDSPYIPTLSEISGEYCVELLDHNFLHRKDYDFSSRQAIELKIEPEILSNSKDIAQKAFQNRFRQLLEDKIIELDNMEEMTLYKIDAIESKGNAYFRFTQKFELLPETGEAKERHDIEQLIYQEHIQKAITAQLDQFYRTDNLTELRQSMEVLNDDDTLKILFGGQLDFSEFIRIYNKYDRKNGLYFLGQIYHQEELFKKIMPVLNNLKEQSNKKLYWLAPSDLYWGKQRGIHDRIQMFIGESKDKYQFRLYLPLSERESKREKQEWQYQFKGISQKSLYGFHDSFLKGNTEILFLEDEFAVVCYHAVLKDYPVTLPIGFFTQDAHKVHIIQKLAMDHLTNCYYETDSKEPNVKDFGRIST